MDLVAGWLRDEAPGKICLVLFHFGEDHPFLRSIFFQDVHEDQILGTELILMEFSNEDDAVTAGAHARRQGLSAKVWTGDRFLESFAE